MHFFYILINIIESLLDSNTEDARRIEDKVLLLSGGESYLNIINNYKTN